MRTSEQLQKERRTTTEISTSPLFRLAFYLYTSALQQVSFGGLLGPRRSQLVTGYIYMDFCMYGMRFSLQRPFLTHPPKNPLEAGDQEAHESDGIQFRLGPR